MGSPPAKTPGFPGEWGLEFFYTRVLRTLASRAVVTTWPKIEPWVRHCYWLTSYLGVKSWLKLTLDLDKMVLDFRKKKLKPTQFYMRNICFNNFAQKSSPGGILGLDLLLTVFGPGNGSEGPGCPEKP